METHPSKKRILPCLLDRLTDRYPKARKESREYRVLNLRQYRLSVARDLEFLFNNQTRPDGKILNEFSYVRQSVLNYGIKYVSGEWADTEGTRHLIQAIEEAIVQFEPRILKETLSVHQSNSPHKRQKSKIHFEIEGELWAEPISEKLFIKTEFDLETGECRVT